MKKGNGVIIFVAGLVIGAIAGGAAVKIYEDRKKKAELDAESEVSDEFKRERKVTHPELVAEKPDLSEMARRYTVSEEALEFEKEMAEAEYPSDDDPDDIDELELHGVDYAATAVSNADKEATKDWEPEIISRDKAANLPEEFEEIELYYFVYDDVLTDENDIELNETERQTLVGDLLEAYGFNNSDNRRKETRLILNYQTQKVYEVTRILGSFEEYVQAKDGGYNWEPDNTEG